jgi:sugar/nucleoside kinase (ribokinase family)
MKILVIGEINPDFILQGYQAFPETGKEVLVDDYHLTLGSASAICAVGMSRLGNDVSFIGKVGVDHWADFCLEQMKNERIDVSGAIHDDTVKTGITVSVTGPEDRALITHLGAMETFSADDIDEGALDGFDHLHMSNYYMQYGLRPGFRTLFELASKKGMTTSFDPQFDPSEEWEPDILKTIEMVDVFLPNEVELRNITGISDEVEALRSLKNGRTLTIAKLGTRGSLTLKDDEPVSVPAFVVQPVDTTGAGDSFDAGFVHSWLRAASPENAMAFGAACGALSTLGLGGTTTQPTEDEANAFVRDQSKAGS